MPWARNIQDTVNMITRRYLPQWNTGQNRDWLEDTLNDFCTSDCLDYLVHYYLQNWNWPDELAKSQINLYQNYYCGSSGQYCLVKFMEYFADDPVYLDFMLQCITRDDKFCSPLCMEVVEGFQNELGCCAVNLFNSTYPHFEPELEVENYFQRCGLSLNLYDICSGALQNNIASLLLLFVAVSLSMFCLSWATESSISRD